MPKPLHLDKSIQELEVLFRYAGMKLIRKPKSVMLTRCLFAIHFLVVNIAFVEIIYYEVVTIMKGMSFIEVTSVTPCMICSSLSTFKSIFYLINEDGVQKFIALLRDLEEREYNREECLGKQNIIKEETGFLSKVVKVLTVLNCLMIVVYDVTPLVIIAVKYFRTNKFEMLLPYLDVFLFPFVPRELKYWIFAYVHQICAECSVLLSLAAVDFLFYTCCTYMRVQFRLLKYDIERIIPKCTITKQLNMYTKDIQDKFVDLVQWHQDLMSLSNILENIFSTSLLVNFLVSSLLICLTGFNLAITRDIAEISTFVIFLFMGLMQVFFLCLFADMMSKASEDVSNGVYACQWYLASPAIGKQLLMVQKMARKPCKLTAAGFVAVDMRAFMKVLRIAWSYFALLQTMYNQ